VESWARASGHEYAFIDDRLFDRLPAWYPEAVGHRLLPRTNLARLLFARDYLAAGHERAIWIDADVLVFDPAKWTIEPGEDGFAFTREIWFETRWGAPIANFGINNAVFTMSRGNPFLDFCIWAHERIARTNTHIGDFATTTRLLTGLNQGAPLPQVTNVALISAVVNRAVREGRVADLAGYMRAHGYPVYAGNLSGSIVGRSVNGILLTPDDQLALIERLLATRGAVLNDQLPAPTASWSTTAPPGNIAPPGTTTPPGTPPGTTAPPGATAAPR
jgi:hypothetical protein